MLEELEKENKVIKEKETMATYWTNNNENKNEKNKNKKNGNKTHKM